MDIMRLHIELPPCILKKLLDQFRICVVHSLLITCMVHSFLITCIIADNAEFYCKRGLPFVMGTTGGDRDRLFKTVKESGVYAVIAPQMGKQVIQMFLKLLLLFKI